MFAGFTLADFEAYAPKKWKSNVFNRERLEVKQKLVSFGRELQPVLSAADGSLLAAEPSVEHPALWNHKQVEAQHLFFFRNEGARKELDAILDRQKSLASLIEDPTPQRNHVFLAMTVNHQSLEISLRLHPDARIDRQNVERKCEDHFEREKFLHLLNVLGEGFVVGVLPNTIPVATLEDGKVRELLAEFSKPQPELLPPGTPPRLFYAGVTLPRDRVLELGAAVEGAARTGLVGLLGLYRFIAWSRENDFVSMREALQKEKQSRRQKGLAKNDPVHIVRGMFAGKSGVVQEIDAKGGIKVLVGKMAVKVDAEDVTKR